MKKYLFDKFGVVYDDVYDVDEIYLADIWRLEGKIKLFFRMVIRSYRVIVGTWRMKRLRHFENLIEKEWGSESIT
jgi:hypothetical protein